MESFKAMAMHPLKSWRDVLSESVASLDGLANRFNRDLNDRAPVLDHYPMRINPYYLSLIRNPDDPLGKQAIPDIRELDGTLERQDPLNEQGQSPVPNLIHRYPDRVVFLVSDTCAMFCRHCMRKRNIGIRPPFSSDEQLERGLRYIRNTPAIRDVILSGGDPLMLDTPKLDRLLTEIRKIPHVDIIRIHSRIPCTLPMRITDNLVRTLSRHHPVYLNTHFNHPDEITDEAAQACTRLADGGIPLGCQTVLLKGVNDSPEIMVALMRKLMRIRVKPYYLHHPDPVAGTTHFRPSLQTGFAIMKALRGHISGIGVPQYMIDLPDGKGKMPLLPSKANENASTVIQVENYLGEICNYPL